MSLFKQTLFKIQRINFVTIVSGFNKYLFYKINIPCCFRPDIL